MYECEEDEEGLENERKNKQKLEAQRNEFGRELGML